MRKNFFSGTSMKSARSIHISPPNGILRVPADSSSGLFGNSTILEPPPQLSITTFTGSRTAMRRVAVWLSSSRTHHSRSAGSLSDSTFETPTRAQNSRIAPGV